MYSINFHSLLVKLLLGRVTRLNESIDKMIRNIRENLPLDNAPWGTQAAFEMSVTTSIFSLH